MSVYQAVNACNGKAPGGVGGGKGGLLLGSLLNPRPDKSQLKTLLKRIQARLPCGSSGMLPYRNP